MTSKILKLVICMFLPIILATALVCVLAGIIALVTPATFMDCSTSVPFWIVWVFTLIGLYIYVNDQL